MRPVCSPQVCMEAGLRFRWQHPGMEETGLRGTCETWVWSLSWSWWFIECDPKQQWSEVKVSQSCPTLWDPMDYIYSPWNSPGQNTGVGSLSLLQRIFPTQGSNLGLPHCRWILYQLSHKGSPRILEWIAYPFSSGSSWTRNWTRVSCIAGGFFTNWAS